MTAPEHQMCVIGQREHRAHDGTLVCSRHADELATWLRDVETETAILDTSPSMQISLGGTGHSGLASQLAPVRLDPLVLRDRRRGTGRLTFDDHDEWGLDDTPSTLETLGSYAAMVRDERHIHSPTVIVRTPGSAPGPFHDTCNHMSCVWMRTEVELQPTVMSERNVLSRQLRWICEQSWVDELHDDLRKLRAALQRANGTQAVSAGVCSTLYEGVECGGTIWHVELEHPGEAPEPGIRCSRCRRVWTGTEAVRLRHQLWLDEQDKQASA